MLFCMLSSCFGPNACSNMPAGFAVRIKCEVEPHELVKILRANVPSLDEGKYNSSDLDIVVEHHVDLVLDILSRTPRVSAKMLQLAAKRTFKASPGEVQLFGNQISSATSYCRKKQDQSTSGKKLAPAVWRVVRFMRDQGLDSQGSGDKAPSTPKEKESSGRDDFASRHARLLKRRRSDSQSPGSRAAKSVTPSSLKSETASVMPHGRAAIFAAMGLTTEDFLAAPARHRELPVLHVDLVSDSSEEEAPPSKPIASAASNSSSRGSYTQVFDAGRMCMVRLYTSGLEECSSMKPGPDAFAVAVFEDGTEFQTQLQNLMLDIKQKPMKRPAACIKRPAASAVDAEEGEGEGEAEEAAGATEEEEETEEEELMEIPESSDAQEEDQQEEEEEVQFEEEEEAAVAQKPVDAKPAFSKASAAAKSYDEVKSAYTARHGQKAWQDSQERQRAIAKMEVPEIKRRRFQHLRPDLYERCEDNKTFRYTCSK